MKHYALIGRPLGHSLSQHLFEEAVPADVADYRLCELPSLDGLRRWVEAEGISGFNVTSPYKEAILPHLDALDPVAEAIGAVNCVNVDDGRLVGHNTDAPAFQQTLEEALTPFTSHLSPLTSHLSPSAVILGTGGAARAVAYALSQMGIPYTFVSRHPERLKVKGEKLKVIGYAELSTFNFQLSTFLPASQALSTAESKYNPAKNFQLLINATPVGTWPNVDASPLPPNFQFSIFNFQLVYDLIYNPSPTRLIREAAACGVATKDGS